MCAGIEFNGQPIRWADQHPILPVLMRDGSVEWCQWGRPGVAWTTSTPSGGLLPLEDIRARKWARFHPKPVKIPARAFLLLDSEDKEHWINIADGFVIQGAAISSPQMIGHKVEPRPRVYIITIPATDDLARHSPRMPRLIKNSNA
ncbi:hypothetical protein [Chromobacterium sinusclupearum]|nr:hypothetical protein [Chromobacterium sinusclupearum]